MSKNSSLHLQKNIKDSAEELQDFLKDLKCWEKEIKAADEKLSSQTKEDRNKSEDTPPVRCKKKLETSSKDSVSDSASGESKPRKNETRNKKKKISAFDYAAWDKFDVDKALESSEDEDTAENEAKTVEKNEKSNSRGPKASKKEQASALKDEGNKLYSSGRLDDAIAKYTQGMALDPTNALLPANRAMAYIKIKKFKAAESDCNRCLKLDDKYVKGYLRRATARMNLNKKEEALKDYIKVLELEPWNKEAKKELENHNALTDSEAGKSEWTQKPDNKATYEKKNEQLAKATKPSENLESVKPKSKVASIQENDKTKKNVKPEVADNIQQGEKSQKNVKLSSSKEKPGKKLNIIEVNSKEEQKQEVALDPNVMLPIDKPPHLRSRKPLKKVSVKYVKTRDSISQQPKVVRDSKADITPVQSKSSQPQIEVKLCASSQVPRTSYQFAKEWSRISKDQDKAIQYLKIIPPSFLSRLELEADTLIEVVSCLGAGSVSPSLAAKCLLALSKCSDFSVTVLFFDDAQKKVLQDVVKKCEGEEAYRSQIEVLKASLP